jgi:hypothetical protein
MRSSRELPLQAQLSRLTTNGFSRYYEMQSLNLRPSRYGLRGTHVVRMDTLHGKALPHTIANRADVKIEMLIYIGEKQRYSFKTHVSNFKQAHLDLQKAENEPDGCTNRSTAVLPQQGRIIPSLYRTLTT